MAPAAFTLYNDGDDFLVVRDGDPAQMLRVFGLPELLRLRARLNQYVDTQQDDGSLSQAMPATAWIDTIAARELAQARGMKMVVSTIISACERGSIAGAHKDGGRWIMPRWAFERWFETWSQRRRS